MSAATTDLLAGLMPAQLEAVTTAGQPLCILAGAGSGKTRVLTRRIAWRVAEGSAVASHALALTFTRRAADELSSRLADLGVRDRVATGTFHAIAYAQLRRRWADTGERPPALLDRKTRLLVRLLPSRRSPSDPGPAELAAEIEWAQARMVSPAGYEEAVAAAGRKTPLPPVAVASVYQAYQDEKVRRHVVDFDDLLLACAQALETDPGFATTQRWRFRHLFVDEFQDVNPLQLGLLDAWRGGHHDLCVVGDPQQAIYGWNGADAGLLTEFRLRYRSAEIVSLDHNYRSTPQVLAAAAHVLRRARVDVAPARATQADGPVPRVLRYLTDVEEARAVARAIRDRRAPQMPWSAQAVLVRTHGQIALLTEGLRVAGIPHHVRGGAALLERDEVRAALRLVRGNDRPLAAMLPDLEALAAEAAADVVADDPAAEAESDLGPAAPAGTVADNLSAVVQLARDHLRLDRQSTGLGFYGWLVATLQAEGIDPAHHDAVTVATFHAAKGLEWPVVHLAGLEDGFVPIGHARTAADRAEEARLLYVAMTRALVGLSGTWAAQRTFNGKVVDRRVCPWLRDLPTDEDVRDPNRPASTADWQAHLADQRAQLAAASTTRTSPTLAALQAWRDEQAQAARVPPAAVVDDQLLEQLAELRPADQDELAAVPGMGPLLARRIGDGLLRALATAPRTNDRSA